MHDDPHPCRRVASRSAVRGEELMAFLIFAAVLILVFGLICAIGKAIGGEGW